MAVKTTLWRVTVELLIWLVIKSTLVGSKRYDGDIFRKFHCSGRNLQKEGFRFRDFDFISSPLSFSSLLSGRSSPTWPNGARHWRSADTRWMTWHLNEALKFTTTYFQFDSIRLPLLSQIPLLEIDRNHSVILSLELVITTYRMWKLVRVCHVLSTNFCTVNFLSYNGARHWKSVVYHWMTRHINKVTKQQQQHRHEMAR